MFLRLSSRPSARLRVALCAVAFGCAVLTSGAASAQVNWKRVGVVSNLTSGQLCRTDGTYVICDSTTPTIAGSQVGIGTTAPNASALLDVFSTTQGLLPPRVTASQEAAIGTNSAMGGLVVYNTSANELDVYNSTTNAWEAVGANAADAAGSTGQVQFNLNSSNELGASANLFWDNTNYRLGIGTAIPSQALEVNGIAKIDTGLIASLHYPAADSTTAIQFDKANGTTNVMDIDTTNGRVGIGTTGAGTLLEIGNWATNNNPYQALQYITDANSTETDSGVVNETYDTTKPSFGIDFRRVWSNGTVTDIGSIEAFGSGSWRGGLLFRTKNNQTSNGSPDTNAMMISPAGNVGIGTTAPGAPLEVANSSGGNLLKLTSGNGISSNTAGILFAEQPGGTQSLAQVTGINDNSWGGHLSFSTAVSGSSPGGALTEKMRILDNGNIGIGTTSPTNILSLGGSAARTIWMERNPTASTAGNGLTVQAGGAASGGTNLTGGNLTLASGISTGTGSSSINFNVYPGNAASTTDNTATTAMVINGAGQVGIGTPTPNAGVALDLGSNNGTSNSSLLLPGGSSTNRPTTGIAGMMRYNSTNAGVEAYYNSAWNSLLTSTSLGTSIPAAGSSGQVQYNNSGVLGGAAGVTYASSGNILTTASQHISDVPLVVQGTGASSLSSGQVAYWKFDEDTGTSLSDATGNGNNGTWQGTLGSQWTTGKINSAGNFNASSQRYVDVSANSALTPTNITVSAWINLSNISTEQMIASDYVSNNTGWYMEVFQSKLNVGLNGNVQLQGGITLSSSTWAHVVFTYDGATLKLYVNGALDSSKTTAAGISNTAHDMYIGAYTGNVNSDKLTGAIDEVGVWNRVLSAGEVTALYNSGTGIQYPFTGIAQTANLAVFQNSVGTTLANVDASGDIATTGTVAVGTASVPTGVTANINGPVKVAGSGSEACSASTVGSMRYNPTGQYMEICTYP